MAETAPSTRGRILAALFLFVITAQSFISDRLVVPDDAVRTAANILANKSLYQLGFTIFMLEMVAQVGVSLSWYQAPFAANPKNGAVKKSVASPR